MKVNACRNIKNRTTTKTTAKFYSFNICIIFVFGSIHWMKFKCRSNVALTCMQSITNFFFQLLLFLCNVFFGVSFNHPNLKYNFFSFSLSFRFVSFGRWLFAAYLTFACIFSSILLMLSSLLLLLFLFMSSQRYYVILSWMRSLGDFVWTVNNEWHLD